jgi:aryl-alcohol dehydrogenase-like predicted oxidoreductase
MLEKRMLGGTDVEVSRIGISSSYGAEQAVYEEAFDRGCSYFTWGTFIKGRSTPFKKFIQGVTSAGNRERMSIGLLSYSHSRLLGDMFLQSALKNLGVEYIDGLLLGYYSKRPPQRILDWAMEVKEKGLVRAIGITTHNRDIVPSLAAEKVLDYYHFRYNAAHRGAEQDIFAKTHGLNIGLVSFTATCWGKLMEPKKMPEGVVPPTAGDCYRFVLAREEIDCCMMGVKNLTMLRQNLDELEKGPMSEEELARIKRIGDLIYGRRSI